MNDLEIQARLIETLVLAAPPASRATRGAAEMTMPAAFAADDGCLALIAGGNMVALSDEIPPPARVAVTLSLLLAQEAAKGDPVAISPDLWVERHDMVLRSLGWASTGGSSQFTRLEKVNQSVHQAIMPLLAAALGPAATAAALIMAGLKQLQEIEKDQPWITLFEKESRRFEHSEYRFVTAELKEGFAIEMRVVALRFKATANRVQVLFFRTLDVDVEFTISTRVLTADAAVLAGLRTPLEKKLNDRANQLIDSIDLPDLA